MLASLEVNENISYARFNMLKKNRNQLLKILWAFGRFGETDKKSGLYLLLSSEDYSRQKIHSYYSKVQAYFRTLKHYGIHCELVPTKQKEWITPTGALRKEGWFMKMSFDKLAEKNMFLLKTFKHYVTVLNEQFGKNAFRYFSRANMNVLC